MSTSNKPKIAIITPNGLSGIGLKSIIEKMMPGADICLFDKLIPNDENLYYHYFIAVNVLLENASFFLEKAHKTIVLVHGQECGRIPKEFHTLNVYQEEDALIRNIVKLAETSHQHTHPEVVERAKPQPTKSPLSKRELEVLQLLVKGHINKEIAAILNVELTTIISHRKHIVEKLNIRSVSALTIYAVSHGLVQAEEI